MLVLRFEPIFLHFFIFLKNYYKLFSPRNLLINPILPLLEKIPPFPPKFPLLPRNPPRRVLVKIINLALPTLYSNKNNFNYFLNKFQQKSPQKKKQ